MATLSRIVAAASIAASTAVVAVSAATAGVAGASGTPIKVGGVIDAANNAGADIGAEAAFDAYNAAGGLDGRKIQYVGTQNDSSTPSSDLTAAKSLMNQGVTAIVPVDTFGWISGAETLAAGVPYFGYAVTAPWWNSQNGFSFIGANSATGSPEMSNIAATGCLVVSGGCKGKAVSIITLNAASSIQASEQFADGFKKAGATVASVTNNIPLPPTVVTDFSPFANSLMSSDNGKPPNIIVAEETSNDDVGLYSQLKALGFTGTFLNFEMYTATTVAQAKGAYTILAGNWLYTANDPQATNVRDAITKYFPSFNQKTAEWTSLEQGWLAAEEFIAAIKKIGPSVTGPKLIADLNKGWTWQGVPSLTGSVAFPAAHKTDAGCSQLVTSNGKEFLEATKQVCNAVLPNPLYQPGSN